VPNRRPARGERANALVREFAPQLEETIGFLLWDTGRAYQRAWAPIVARQGVPSGLYYFLRILYERDGLTLRQISDAAHMRGPTVVEGIREMERRGLVRRAANRDDSRKVNVFLTARGRSLHRALVPLSAEFNRRGVAGLTPEERTMLKRLLRHIRANMNGRAHF
jgi:DNA-binding MarR family transcriptional regulator